MARDTTLDNHAGNRRETQATAVGNSSAVILPKEPLARLRLTEGDALYATELPDDGIKLSPFDPSSPGKWKPPSA